MMTVRFPNGQTFQYNRAHFLHHGSNSEYILKTAKDGDSIAFIQSSAGVVVEFESPCRVYNPLQQNQLDEIKQLAREVRLLKRKLVK